MNVKKKKKNQKTVCSEDGIKINILEKGAWQGQGEFARSGEGKIKCL